MSDSGREKLDKERLLKDYHLTRKILFLFLTLVLSVMTFGLYMGSEKLNNFQDNRELCMIFLLFSIVALTIFVFRSATRTFETYFDIKDKKYVIRGTSVCDKSIYKNKKCDLWIETELNKEEPLRLDKKTYNSVNRNDNIYVIYLNNNVIGVYPKQNYYLDYEEFVENSKKKK